MDYSDWIGSNYKDVKHCVNPFSDSEYFSLIPPNKIPTAIRPKRIDVYIDYEGTILKVETYDQKTQKCISSKFHHFR